MVIKCSDEIEPETEAASAMAVGYFENAKDFELANHMFSESALFGAGAVMVFLLLSERFTLPALVRGAALGVALGYALEAAV